MSERAVSRLFFGGMPTEPDVRRLTEAFGGRGSGDSVTYDEISVVIGVAEKTSRFRVVVTAWRRRLRKERNIVTVCIAGARSVYMLRDEERAPNAFRDARTHIRGIGRAHGKAVDIPVERLTEPQRHTAEHTRRVLGAMSAATRAGNNELAVTFAPPKQLPRVT